MGVIICIACGVVGFLAGVHSTYYVHDLYSNPKMNRSTRVNALESELEELIAEMRKTVESTSK